MPSHGCTSAGGPDRGAAGASSSSEAERVSAGPRCCLPRWLSDKAVRENAQHACRGALQSRRARRPRNEPPARDRRDGGFRNPPLQAIQRARRGFSRHHRRERERRESQSRARRLLFLVRSGSELDVRDTALVPRQRPSTGRPDRRRRECRSRRRASVSTSRTPRPPPIVQSRRVRQWRTHTRNHARHIQKDGVDGPGGGRNSFEREIDGANIPRRGGPFADRYAGSSLSTRRWAEGMPACGGRVRPRSART